MRLKAKFTARLKGNPIKGQLQFNTNGTWDQAIKEAEKELTDTGMTAVEVYGLQIVPRR